MTYTGTYSLGRIVAVKLLTTFVVSLIFPSAIGLTRPAADYRMLLLVFFVVFIVSGVIIFISRSYYILKLELDDNKVSLLFYHWFKLQKIETPIEQISFQLSPLKYRQKYLEIYVKNERVLSQFPYVDWNMEKIHQLRDTLLKAGILEKE